MNSLRYLCGVYDRHTYTYFTRTGRPGPANSRRADAPPSITPGGGETPSLRDHQGGKFAGVVEVLEVPDGLDEFVDPVLAHLLLRHTAELPL